MATNIYKKRLWQEIGQRIADFQKSKNLKNKEIAEIVNVNPSHYPKYLDGTLDPLNLIEKLVEYGADRDYLLTGNMKIKELEQQLYRAKEYIHRRTEEDIFRVDLPSDSGNIEKKIKK